MTGGRGMQNRQVAYQVGQLTSARPVPLGEGHTRSAKVNCVRKGLQESVTSGTDLMPFSPLCSSMSSSLVSLSSASNTPTRWTTCTGTPPGVGSQGHHQAGLGATTISSTGHFAPGQSSLMNSQPTDAEVGQDSSSQWWC